MAKWDTADVVTLLEKGVGYIVGLVRAFKTPDRVLKHIVDRTQELRDIEKSIDEELAEKYGRQDQEGTDSE
jgi:hypothetical protein